MAKVYITQYALTRGIEQAEIADDLIVGSTSSYLRLNGEYVHQNNYFMTMHGAIEKAELMRQRKIAGLEKQIAKLKELKF